MVDEMMAGTLEQCKAMFETRIAALESLVEQQATQIGHLQQLGELESRLTQLAHEVSALHLDHSVLKDDHQALTECLISGGTLVVSKLQLRRRVCKSLSAFCSLTESKERMQSMKSTLGQGQEMAQLSMASRAFAGVLKLAVEKTQPPRHVGDLHDDALWQELKDYEPLPSELDKWERSALVSTVIGNLKVEGVLSKSEGVKFSDVLKIFSHLGLTLDQFVDKFTRVRRNRSAEEVEDMTTEILKRFAQKRAGGGSVMPCRDLYRLLEVVGYPLHRFRTIYNGSDEEEAGAQSAQKLGGYRIRNQISQGRSSASYLGEHVSDQTKVIIKWPAPREELNVLKEIQRAATQGSLGVPKLLAHGDSQREPYFVTELLGSSLGKVFQHLEAGPSERRWPVLRVMGRLLVRRLQALHGCGFLHCDISPENVVLGRARAEGSDAGSQLLALYFVDFEHAQRYPGAKKAGIDVGSIEWSSIRSGDGGEPLPQDDLEAVGWTLLNGLLGDLPWFSWLSAAYKDWESQWTRYQAVKQVQLAKTSFITKGGWKSFCSRKGVKMPEELTSFFHACRPDGGATGKPDYGSLVALLGGKREQGTNKDEREDLGLLTESLSSL